MPEVTMRPLSPADLLNAWDAGMPQSPTRRALVLLSLACREPIETVAALSIGARDRLLLTLREWTFGSRIAARTDCPACGERIECAIEIRDIVKPPIDAPPPFETDGRAIGYRMPDSTDLEAITDIAHAREQLLARCVDIDPSTLPAPIVEALIQRIADADPQADIQLAFDCPACAHRWSAHFDIVTFLWSEVHAWARRMLRDVHSLASAYGWSERDILALSQSRRQAYLEMLTSE